MSNIETYFLITVNTDGTLTSYTEVPAEAPVAARVATNFDVYEAAKQIVQEFDNQLLADRIARAVVAQLTPKAETPADKIKDALKERGIKPESVTPAE